MVLIRPFGFPQAIDPVGTNALKDLFTGVIDRPRKSLIWSPKIIAQCVARPIARRFLTLKAHAHEGNFFITQSPSQADLRGRFIALVTTLHKKVCVVLLQFTIIGVIKISYLSLKTRNVMSKQHLITCISRRLYCLLFNLALYFLKL